MKQNSFKKPVTPPKEKKRLKFKVKAPKLSGANTIGKFLQSIIDGTFLARENSVKTIPFLVFVTFIALLYIANTFLAERTIRSIETTKMELKELRAEYLSLKSEVMFGRNQSIVAKKILPTGIKESVEPPKKIIDKKPKTTTE